MDLTTVSYVGGVVLLYAVVLLLVWLSGQRRGHAEAARAERLKLANMVTVGPVPVRAEIAEERLLEALAVPATHPVFAAALAVIEQQIAAATLQVSNPEMVKTDGGALPVVHTAGGIEWLNGAREALIELRVEAERRQREGDAA